MEIVNPHIPYDMKPKSIETIKVLPQGGALRIDILNRDIEIEFALPGRWRSFQVRI